MIFLDAEDLLHIAGRVLAVLEVRDPGLLESAAARPQTTVFGEDAYPTIHGKAAALVHSVARNHALADGNRRLVLAAAIASYGLNGYRLTLTGDEAYDLIISIASGELDSVEVIAPLLELGTRRRQ